MKRLIFVGLLGLCAASVLYGWQYSAQTTWDGAHHQSGATNFTPGSTTAYLTETSPTSPATCPCYSQDPPCSFDYYSIATLFRGGTTYTAQVRCGGCAYAIGSVTLETWTVKASLNQVAGNEIQGQGPVKAIVANPQVLCQQTGPEGE